MTPAGRALSQHWRVIGEPLGTGQLKSLSSGSEATAVMVMLFRHRISGGNRGPRRKGKVVSYRGTPVSLEIVVPAYNEATRLPAGLAMLCGHMSRPWCDPAVIVVDNASTDATAAVVSGFADGRVPTRLVRCARRGKGAAVRAGLLATTAPYVGFCDADMATDLDVLEYVLYLLTHGQPVVVGSRALSASVVEVRHGPVRAVGSALFRRLARAVLPGSTDTQCGFKFFDGPLVRTAAAGMRSTGFAFDVELLARCRALGGDFLEIPVIWRDVPGSTFSVGGASLNVLKELARTWSELGRQPARAQRPTAWSQVAAARSDAPSALSSAATPGAAPLVLPIVTPDLGASRSQ